ncbi:hypothetical protein [Natranaeroarchaeum sulfidigenes]|uniref:Uncharacterized protein n=1 Tax=Natranaeroarchaeum sulfidigenes TaxID=2784880 RepID=A0A897MWK0_9EURY|nr:hypothetical protein [Natranaeroarchaeum sulfidigenes]QSG02536.1 hypothetical protein AArcS_1319 [Natranaeroarchaeum sulfidigenes]
MTRYLDIALACAIAPVDEIEDGSLSARQQLDEVVVQRDRGGFDMQVACFDVDDLYPLLPESLRRSA